MRLREPQALNAIGLSIGRPELDFAKTIAWKDSIVARLTGGVGALLKKAKVRTLLGSAAIVDGKTVIARADTGESRIEAEHLDHRHRLGAGRNCRRCRSAATSCPRPSRWR